MSDLEQQAEGEEHKLPYVFDLFFDVKTMEQVERIARGEGDHSSATPYELYEMFEGQNLPIPECLKVYTNPYIWIDQTGTWQKEKPPEHDMFRFKKARYV